VGGIYTKRKFAWFPVQLGSCNNYGDIVKPTTRIWWEPYFVDYTIHKGFMGAFETNINKYQNIA